MKRMPVIPIKWINEQHDSDRDGVPNYRDCNPFNPHEHTEHRLSLFPKFTKPYLKGLTKSNKYTTMWGQVLHIYKEIGGPSHIAILDTAPECKHPDVFNFINSKLNKSGRYKGEVGFQEIVNKFYDSDQRFIERIFETIKWMLSHNQIGLIMDGAQTGHKITFIVQDEKAWRKKYL